MYPGIDIRKRIKFDTTKPINNEQVILVEITEKSKVVSMAIYKDKIIVNVKNPKSALKETYRSETFGSALGTISRLLNQK